MGLTEIEYVWLVNQFGVEGVKHVFTLNLRRQTYSSLQAQNLWKKQPRLVLFLRWTLKMCEVTRKGDALCNQLWSSCIKYHANCPLFSFEHKQNVFSLTAPSSLFPPLSCLPLSPSVFGGVSDRPYLQWPCSKHWARIAWALGRYIFMQCVYFLPQRRSRNSVFPRWAKQTTSKEFKCSSCKFSPTVTCFCRDYR